MNQREEYFIFKIAGYLNINDVDFKKIKHGQHSPVITAYTILGVTADMPISEIRTAYRKLVLKYHPDRNKNVTAAEKKKLEIQFQQVKEAYQKIKDELS
jgi:DnaJ like chaperone protein